MRRSRPGPGGRGLPIRPPRRRDNVGSSTGADRAPRCIASNASVIKLDAPPDSAAGGRTLARPILGTRRLASPIEATRDGDLQDSSMGGTGLEPVTPSLSIWRRRSRQFAGVRSNSMVERNPCRDRTLERTRTNADPCHSCHAAQPSGLVLKSKHALDSGEPLSRRGSTERGHFDRSAKEHESHEPGRSQDSITTLMGSARCAIRAVRVRGDNRHPRCIAEIGTDEGVMVGGRTPGYRGRRRRRCRRFATGTDT